MLFPLCSYQSRSEDDFIGPKSMDISFNSMNVKQDSLLKEDGSLFEGVLVFEDDAVESSWIRDI